MTEDHNSEDSASGRVMQTELQIPYTPDESRITLTQWEGTYWLSMGNLHGPGDVTVEFDSFRYNDATLSFQKHTDEGAVTTAFLDWHLLDAGGQWGDVDEWIRDRIDLDEYRTNAKCPECGSEILNDGVNSGCENLECDVFLVEGIPDNSWETYEPGRDADD